MNWPNVTPTIRAGIERYVHEGIACGSFLNACLENDFQAACRAADSNNAVHLHEIAAYIRQHVPMQIRGSRAAVDAHIVAKQAERDKAWMAARMAEVNG